MLNKQGEIMKAVIRTLTIATVVALLSACANEIVRPAPGTFALGKSEMKDVIGLMGEPSSRDEVLVNGEKVQTITYVKTEEVPGGSIAPQRTLLYSFYDGTLVGQEFQSSFSNESTLFDEKKIAEIIRGKSTKSDVIEALGEPAGEMIFPLVKNRGDEGVIYGYSLSRNVWIGMRTDSQRFVVTISKAGVVTEMSYAKNGVRQLLK
jgi:hypothetical protein